MDIDTMNWVVTIVAFGAIGWLIASRRSTQAGPLTFIVLLGLAVGGYYVGVDTLLLDVNGFIVLLNWAIASCCIGGAVGLLVRNRSLRRLQDA